MIRLGIGVVIALSLSSCCQGQELWGNLSDCQASGWPVPAPPPGVTLRQVHAIIRHGDRTPWSGDYCWPMDNSVWDCQLTSGEIPMYCDGQYGHLLPRIYRKIYSFGDETLSGNCSIAQLTSLGFSQHMVNGEMLNSAYVKSGFLSKTLSAREIYMRSDDMSRTLMSAQSLMLGMYPPNSDPVSYTETVELNTMDPSYEYMVANPILCPKYGNYSESFQKSKVWLSHLNTTKAILADIQSTTHFSPDESDIVHYADCLRTHKCHKLDMPEGMTAQLYERIQTEVSWQFYNLYKFPSVEENARVGIGFLLKEIWKNMNATVAGKPKEKFLLYSGHDTTLMPILVALGVADGVWPSYASMILVELYETNSKSSFIRNTRYHPGESKLQDVDRFAVRLIYNGKILSLPFCSNTLGSGLCSYRVLSDYMRTVTPSDNVEMECNLSSFKNKWKWQL